jgi:hypothetical protein
MLDKSFIIAFYRGSSRFAVEIVTPVSPPEHAFHEINNMPIRQGVLPSGGVASANSPWCKAEVYRETVETRTHPAEAGC